MDGIAASALYGAYYKSQTCSDCFYYSWQNTDCFKIGTSSYAANVCESNSSITAKFLCSSSTCESSTCYEVKNSPINASCLIDSETSTSYKSSCAEVANPLTSVKTIVIQSYTATDCSGSPRAETYLTIGCLQFGVGIYQLTSCNSTYGSLSSCYDSACTNCTAPNYKFLNNCTESYGLGSKTLCKTSEGSFIIANILLLFVSFCLFI